MDNAARQRNDAAAFRRGEPDGHFRRADPSHQRKTDAVQ